MEEVAAVEQQRLEDQPQFYAKHLGEINETHEVVSVEDIFNDRGLLIARKGTRINPALSQKILQHKLVKPLHAQVNISNGLTEMALADEYEGLYERYPDLNALVESLDAKSDFDRLVRGVRVPRIFLQNLTVLRERKPHIYEKALFGALMGTLLAQTLKLSSSDSRAAYFAGLIHDIGLLHINPAIVDKLDAGEELSAAEMRAVHSHVVVGQLLVDEVAQGAPPFTSRAVLEHHERCDASGYPAAASASQLHMVGQMVALADELHDLRRGYFAKTGYTLFNAVPFLQLNSNAHFYELYEAARLLLRRARQKPKPVNPEGTLAAFVARLVAASQRLEQVLPVLERLREQMVELKSDRSFRGVVRAPARLLRMMHASGVARAELRAWLESEADDSALGELVDLHLLQYELLAQLRRYDAALRAHPAASQLAAAAQPLTAWLADAEA